MTDDDDLLTMSEFTDVCLPVRVTRNFVKCVEYIIRSLNYYLDQVIRGLVPFIKNAVSKLREKISSITTLSAQHT
jgi:hypothetical protein